ncbi:MAG: amidase [Proteobacteria bacterium]|nr:amidase [Pseudomonadota bacterium]
MSIAFDSATALCARLRKRELSSRELTELYIRRIEKHDPGLNAVVVRDFERALEAADRADAERAKGVDGGPFHGLPMTIKEAYEVEGLATTWGIPAFAKNIATQNAAVVERLLKAGGHFLGKTNVPLHLADFQSYNDIYGTTRNPWNPERTPGGSSGGSAAALAAGFCGLESGSDIGGSIRNPAHFCGVYGHKPTYGIVPNEGHALPGLVAAPDLAVVGPMARSAEDLALAMDVVAGADRFHADGWQLALPKPAKRALSEYRVAVWPSEPGFPVSTAVADRVQEVADRLAQLGATVSDRARPAFAAADSHDTYSTMLHGQLSAAFTDEAFDKLAAGAKDLDPGDRSDGAAVVRATLQTHRDWVRATHDRARLRLAWKAFFADWDILVCPQMPTTAFPHDHSPYPSRTLQVDGRTESYARQIFWAGLITVAYLPSTVFPTGVAADGLPIGLQAVGPEYHDAICIDFARLLADEIGGFTPPAGYDD